MQIQDHLYKCTHSARLLLLLLREIPGQLVVTWNRAIIHGKLSEIFGKRWRLVFYLRWLLSCVFYAGCTG